MLVLKMGTESTSGGFSDEQLRQIGEIAQQVADSSGDVVSARIDSLSNQVDAAVSQAIPSAFASALDSRSGAVQVVTISAEQWDLLSESCRIQNTTTLFAPLLVASLLGALVFMLFSAGFRHG